MTWRQCIILISSVAVIGASVKLVVACASGEPDPGDEPTFFFNTVNDKPVYTPFYYTPYLTIYYDYYGFDSGEFKYHPHDENTRSWKAYTGSAVKEADIDSFLYKFAANDVMRIYDHIRKDYTLSVPQKVAQNQFTKWLVTHKDHEAVLYLAFAKQCERHALPVEVFWDDAKNQYASAKRDSGSMQELVHEGIKRFSTATNPDIKIRYAYQVTRMAYYSHEYPQTLLAFNAMLPSGCHHYLYYRCLSLRAGAMFRMGRKNEAAYYYSHVFDSSDEQKQQSYTSFRWAINGNIDQVLPLCKSDHERAVLYLMRGLYDYGPSYFDRWEKGVTEPKAVSKMIATINAAYQYDPHVRGLDVLMTRYINQLEAPAIPRIATSKPKTNTAVEDLNKIAMRIAGEGKTGDKAYWLLASAYLYMLDADADNCSKQLAAAKAAKMTAAEEDVHYVISTLYTIRKKGKINAETEAELLPMLMALDKKVKKAARYAVLFRTITETVMAQAYLAQHDSVRAVYCYSRAYVSAPQNYYFILSMWNGSTAGELLESMSPDQLHVVQAFLAKQNKTPFEKWLMERTYFPEEVLYELEGTKYMRLMQFGKAVEVLKKVPDSLINKTVLPDAFVSHMTDYMRRNKSDSNMFYNKLTFATRMYELQQKLAQDQSDSRSAYQYANGLYSMSYYGKANEAVQYFRSGTDYRGYYLSKDRALLSRADQEYYAVRTPEQYYKQAYNNSTDPEFKARCIFLAAKCWQKNCPVTDTDKYFIGDEKQYYLNSLKNPYFRQLKEEFDQTIFYKKAKGTCAYLQDYADTHK